MTNKKIDIWLRFILYLVPIVMLLFLMICNKGTSTFSDVSSFNILLTDFNESFSNISFLQPFTSWFETNVTTNVYVLFGLYYCFYTIFIELALLFKNVLAFIIKVANEFIERGAEIGK